MRWLSWPVGVRLLFGALFGVGVLAAQCPSVPCITSLGAALPGEAPPTPTLPGAFTAGTSLGAGYFYLYLEGTFNTDYLYEITWYNPATEVTTTFAVEGDYYSFSPTQIVIRIGSDLYGALTSAGAQVTEIEYNTIESGPEFLYSNPATFNLNPALGPPTGGTTLPAGIVGVPYSAPFAAGGTPPYSVTLTSGAPPPGLPLPAASEILSGTPTAPGVFTFTPSITDAWGNVFPAASSGFTESVTVLAALSITTPSLPPATVGVPYSAPVGAIGGTPPYGWTAAGLPSALTINHTTGVISGVPGAVGSYTVTVTVMDSGDQTAYAVYTLLVVPPVTITTSSTLTPGTVHVAYSNTIAATGGVPPYTFTLTAGALPTGVTLALSGALTGTPTVAGTYGFTVKVTDSVGSYGSQTFTLVIQPPPLTITTTTLPTGTVGVAYSTAIEATGGVGPYTFSLTTGALPTGLSLVTAGGITGTPTVSGPFGFTVTVTDSRDNTASQAYTLVILGAPLSITTTTLAPVVVGAPIDITFGAMGGVPPYLWSAPAGLPTGFALTPGGVLTAPGQSAPTSFTFQIELSDSTVCSPFVACLKPTVTQSFTLNIVPAPLKLTTTSLPNGQVGTAYSATLAATGGTAPYTWAESGLPVGLSITPATGAIGGTPITTGTSSATITVTDSKGVVYSALYLVTISPAPLTISTTALPQGTVGAAYNATVSASGGTPPYTSWTATGVPAGITFSSGAFSGMPSSSGTSMVVVTVTDSAGTTASQKLSLSVVLPPTPPVTFSGTSPTVEPATQPTVQIGLGSAYPAPITVNLTLTFTPVSGADDPSVQFAGGGRTASATIATGDLLSLPAIPVQTGTVAGAITITAQLLTGTQDITPTPAPSVTMQIAPAAPVISSVTAAYTTTGFTVTIVGFATTRQVTTANFQFTAAGGSTLTTSSASVSVGSLFSGWYGSSNAAPYGSQFTFTQPFTVSGSPQSVASVSVTLANSQGTSPAASATIQ